METLPEKTNQLTAKSLFGKDTVKQKFNEMLGKKAQGFITSVLQIVSQNSLLAKADPNSVLQSAMMAATLDLPLNNNLGFAYIVPYNQKYKDDKGIWQAKSVAQFQMGYKGFIQLAQRSGQFKTISSTPIYEGQLVEQNPLTGFVFDFTKKTSNTVIGYAAFFQLLNGFEKTLYMTVEELKKHGGKYSKSFDKTSGLWNTDFDAMATKTVLKLLLSKFAPMSIEMQKATLSDQGVISDAETNEVEYVDHVDVTIDPVDKEVERIILMIEDAKTKEELEQIKEHVGEGQLYLWKQKMKEVA